MALCVCFGISAALADMSPVMPAPSDAPVYWRLTDIEQTPEVRAAGGYSIHYDITGLDLDLGDGLLTESLLQADDAIQGMTLIADKDEESLMEHTYAWSPLPIYLEPGVSYPIEVTGQSTVGSADGGTPNSLLGIYLQGDLAARISAGGYTGHASSAVFEISADKGVYRDGSLVVSIILRDVNDMFRDRIAYTYTMEQGVKPVPTPKPGFDPVELPATVRVPEYYEPVEGVEGLWRIVTAPDEYRAYGSMSGSEPTFFPADAEGAVVMNERPADHDADFETHVKGFFATKPEKLPEQYREIGELYGFTARDSEEIVRAHGRLDGGKPAFYPVNENGEVDAETAKPVDPAQDYEDYIKGFGAAELPEDEAIAFYRPAGEGLYTFKSRDGETFTRAYGRLNGAEPAFYEADDEGNVAEDAKPVDPQADFEAYLKGFDAAKLPELPEHYEIVDEGLYAVIDRDGERVYRVYGIKDGADAAFYPADEEGNMAEDAEAVTPEADFEAHVAGFEPGTAPETVPDYYLPTEVEGVWSFADKNGETQYRTYGALHRGSAAFYPSDATGEVSHDALPVEPASDLTLMPTPPFTPMIPEMENIPPFYLPVEATSLYSFVDMEGNVVYRVYGAYGSNTPQFYPADADGNPIENAEPIDPATDYETYFGTFAAEEPEEAPEHYTPVEGKVGVYAYTNKHHQTVYRIYGKAEAIEPGFFPADEQGRIVSGVRIDPQTDAGDTPMELTKAIVTPTPPESAPTPLVRTPGTPEPVPEATPTLLSATVSSQSMNPANALGTVTSDPSAPVEATAEITEAPTEAATEEPTEPVATEAPVVEDEKGGLPSWVIPVGIGAVVVIGGAVYFVRRNKKDEKK